MRNIENAKKFRLRETTTEEMLPCEYNCVLQFGDKVLLAGYYYNGRKSYFAAVYEYTTEDHTCEGEIQLKAVSEEMFEDNGHAIAWAMNN